MRPAKAQVTKGKVETVLKNQAEEVPSEDDKNTSDIKWINRVHERLVGAQRYGMFPTETVLAIRHYKDIARQERQNQFYNEIHLRG